MLLMKLMRMRVIKVEANEFISIRKNVEYLGTDVLAKFHQIHTVTGCDTTSFLHSVGKNSLKSFSKVCHWKRKAHNSKYNRCFMQSSRHCR